MDGKYRHYDCRRCANKETPLCSLCTQIRSPSGKETKPKYYMGLGTCTVPSPYGMKVNDMEQALTQLLQVGEPLPLNMVLVYNHIQQKEE